jgi:hypothetical protein
MKKNQKGFGKIGIIILIVFVLLCIDVVFKTVSNNQDKNTKKSGTTSSQSTAPAKPTVHKNANWAGYLKYGTSGTGKDMTAVSGEWIVPDITPTENFELSATWIGIGGYGNLNQDLIQMGTDQDTGPNLSTGKLYYAFWECWPQLATRIPDVKVSPGDDVQSSITKVGSNWSLSLTDKTNGGSFSKTLSCNPDQSTAEWVMENVAPGGQDIYSAVLPKITPTIFSNTTVNGKAPGITDTIQLLLVNNSDQTIAAPSDLTGNGTGFTIRDAR